MINDLSRRVKFLQGELNTVTKNNHKLKETVMAAPIDRSSQRSIPRGNTKSVLKSRTGGKLNMTVSEDERMPPLDRSISQMSYSNKKRKSKIPGIIGSSKDKMFTLDTDEDKQIMHEIDQFDPEQLRINLLQQLKANSKLENNLEAVKREMASKISLLRREAEVPKPLYNTNRPESTLSRQSNPQNSKVQELQKDREEAYLRITTLENELKNQEQFFRSKLSRHADNNSKVQEDDILGQSKFVNIMGKLSEEQSKFYADKKKIEVGIKDTVEAANQKASH